VRAARRRDSRADGSDKGGERNGVDEAEEDSPTGWLRSSPPPATTDHADAPRRRRRKQSGDVVVVVVNSYNMIRCSPGTGATTTSDPREASSPTVEIMGTECIHRVK